MTVPFSEAVAINVPFGVSETAASGELCAGTSHTTWRLRQSWTTTVPAEDDDGSARSELSASALKAHTPRGFDTVSMVRWTHSVPVREGASARRHATPRHATSSSYHLHVSTHYTHARSLRARACFYRTFGWRHTSS